MNLHCAKGGGKAEEGEEEGLWEEVVWLRRLCQPHWPARMRRFMAGRFCTFVVPLLLLPPNTICTMDAFLRSSEVPQAPPSTVFLHDGMGKVDLQR